MSAPVGASQSSVVQKLTFKDNNGTTGAVVKRPSAPSLDPCKGESCRLVVLDWHRLLVRNHDEGTFDAETRADPSRWFYDAAWVKCFVNACRARNIGVGVATFLHDLHDGVEANALKDVATKRAFAFYDTSSLLALPHNYDNYMGGPRLIQDIFQRHAGITMPEHMIAAYMPLASREMHKNEHITRLIAAHNRTCAVPSARVEKPYHVWLFDDSRTNISCATFHGFTAAVVLPRYGFSKDWFRYALQQHKDSSDMTVTVASLVALVRLCGLEDAFRDEIDALGATLSTVCIVNGLH